VYSDDGGDGDWFDGDETVSDVSVVGNEYVFQGRRFDEESGLYYFRNRYYSAELGRFVSRDPIGFGGGDLNLYRFVGNMPIDYLDPNGLRYYSLSASGGKGGKGGTITISVTESGGVFIAVTGGFGIGKGASITVNEGEPTEGFSTSVNFSGGMKNIGGEASFSLSDLSFDSENKFSVKTSGPDLGAGFGIGAGASAGATVTVKLFNLDFQDKKTEKFNDNVSISPNDEASAPDNTGCDF
jgi:RHS repeat-associated protein